MKVVTYLAKYNSSSYFLSSFGIYDADKRYAYLASLDLICDHPQNYDLWINEVHVYRLSPWHEFLLILLLQLKSRINDQQQSFTHPRLSSQENDVTDTTILYLFLLPAKWSSTG